MKKMKKGQTLDIIGIVIFLIILGFIGELIYLYLFAPEYFSQIVKAIGL